MNVKSKDSFTMIDNVDETTISIENSQWQLGGKSRSFLFKSVDSASYRSQGSDNHELQVIKKKEITSTRSVIPATRFEKLSYLQAYISSLSKTDYSCAQHLNFYKFFWNYLYNVFGKSLPSCYIYLFLGSYAPEHHLYLSKMVPAFYGLNFIWIIVALMELVLCSRLNFQYLDYAFYGIMENSPWNRCWVDSIDDENNTFVCLELDEFIEMFSNTNMTSLQDPNNETIKYHLPQQIYLLYFHRDAVIFPRFIVCIFWIISSMLCNKIFKRNLWKLLKVCHWTQTTIYACALLYLYTVTDNGLYVDTISMLTESYSSNVAGADIELMAESMTSPPILHVLTSRSKEEVKISIDTVIIITSNTLFYLFRGLLIFKLRKYCIELTKIPAHETIFLRSVFVFWPIFFSTLNIGPMLSSLFYVISFLVEFLTFTVTHQFLIEVVYCEWPFLKRFMVAVILIVIGCLLYFPYSSRWDNILAVLTLCATNVITVAEVLVISVFYRLDRLIEDMTFYYGNIPSMLTVVVMRCMSIHYLVKTINVISSILNLNLIPIKYFTTMMEFFLYILLLGAIIKSFILTCVEKKPFLLIWFPAKNWGPLGVMTRILRKQFDMEKYIASQAARELSRNMIHKSESKMYRLGLQYSDRRSASLNNN